jgi:hypothetical protein
MAKMGIQIPPDVIVEESLLSSGQKEKINAAMQAQAVAIQKQRAVAQEGMPV